MRLGLSTAMAVAVMVGGCSSSSGGAGGAGGTGTGGSGGASDGGGDALSACGASSDPSTGLTCNTLLATGACVTPTVMSGSPTAAAGGSLQAGTYDLASVVSYYAGDASAPTAEQARREFFVASGTGSSSTVELASTSGSMTVRQTATVGSSGTMLLFTTTCPPVGDGGFSDNTQGYTATATTFVRQENRGGGGVVVNTYMKR